MTKCHLCKENEVKDKWDTCAKCNEPQEPHTCPYNEEINNDSETLCTCSKAEEYECCMDI
jgi:hypothetical protein